jgi:hypothetical protein
MGIQFITKRFMKRPDVKRNHIEAKIENGVKEVPMEVEQLEVVEVPQVSIENELDVQPLKNKKNKKEKKDMLTKEQLSAIENAVEGMNPTVKVVKTDRGLIERTESSKIIITEDNRQVLND